MKQLSRDIYYLTIIGVVVTLPFDITVNSLATVLHVVAWIFFATLHRRTAFAGLKGNYVCYFMISFSLFYLLSAVFRFNGYSDFDIALKNLEIRLPFLLFPLTLAGITLLSAKKIKNIFSAFVISIFIATFVCLIFAIVATVDAGSVYSWDMSYSYIENYFMYHRLASWLGIHAVYFSMYVTIAFFMVLLNLVGRIRRGNLTMSTKMGFYFLLIYFAAIIFLLNSITISFAFLFGLFAVALIYLVPLLHWSKKRVIILGVVFASLAIAFSAMMFDKLDIKQSVLQYNFEDEYPNANWNSLTLRLAKWDVATQVIKNEWLWGSGAGQHYCHAGFLLHSK